MTIESIELEFSKYIDQSLKNAHEPSFNVISLVVFSLGSIDMIDLNIVWILILSWSIIFINRNLHPCTYESKLNIAGI